MAIGLATGLIGGIGKMFGRKKANKQLEEMIRRNPQYKENPLAAQRLGLSQALLNARAPGAAMAERNIYANQASQFANVNRNATDASQALGLAGGIGGSTNQAFNELGMQEANDYQRRLGNLEGAQQGMIQEGDKVFNDQVRRFGDEVQMRGAQQQNKQAGWGDLSNLGFSLMDFGMAGGFGSMFGGGANSPQRTSFSPTQQQGMQGQPQFNQNQFYQQWQTPGYVPQPNFYNRPR
jgi:hypothetical protein